MCFAQFGRITCSEGHRVFCIQPHRNNRGMWPKSCWFESVDVQATTEHLSLTLTAAVRSASSSVLLVSLSWGRVCSLHSPSLHQNHSQAPVCGAAAAELSPPPVWSQLVLLLYCRESDGWGARRPITGAALHRCLAAAASSGTLHSQRFLQGFVARTGSKQRRTPWPGLRLFTGNKWQLIYLCSLYKHWVKLWCHMF